VFLKHFAYTREPVDCRIDALVGAGAPGETVTLSFSMLAEEACNLIEVTSSALKSSLKTLDLHCVDLHIVKIWEQSGLGIYQSDGVMVPELLLKDDRIELKDGYRRKFKRLRHIMEPFWLYEPPQVRLYGPVCTSMQPGQSKQVIVSIRIPPDALSGHYAAELIVKEDGKISTLSIGLEVYPISLVQARQDAMIWFKGSLDWRDRQHYVPEKIFRRQLEDIYNTGFRSVSINETDTSLTQRAIDIAEQIGFNRHLLIFWPRSNDLHKLRFRKATPVYFISDELDLQIKQCHGQGVQEHPQVKAHMLTASAAKQVAGKTLVTVYIEPNARELSKQLVLDAVDVQSYYLPKNTEHIFFRSQFEQMRKSDAYYYWPAHMEKPDLHRVLAGLYLWKSGVEGIQPYCYQHLPQYPFSAYNDFDESEPNTDLEDEPRSFRDHLSTYPSKDGPIPTLQWLGMREGLTDLRYLNTLDLALERVESISSGGAGARAAAIREIMEKFLDRIDLRSISINSEFDPQPYPHIQSHEYHEFRKFCALSIIQLQQMASSFNICDQRILTEGV